MRSSRKGTPAEKRKNIYFTSCDPHHIFQAVYLDIDSNILPTSVSDIYLDVYSDSLSDMYSGILFV